MLPCATCSDGSTCLTCKFGYSYDSDISQCVSVCLSGYYESNEDYECHECYSTCATCLSYSECLSCNSPYVYFEEEAKCLSSCPAAYLLNTTTNTCVL